jgi:uncharacterized protein (DUF362 family)
VCRDRKTEACHTPADLDGRIVDLNRVIKSDLTILGGIVGMEGLGGPTNGRAVRMDVIVAGDNVVETDSVGVRVMGGDPAKVEHVRLSSEMGIGSLDGFEILGESVESAGADLDLPRRPELNALSFGERLTCDRSACIDCL